MVDVNRVYSFQDIFIDILNIVIFILIIVKIFEF